MVVALAGCGHNTSAGSTWRCEGVRVSTVGWVGLDATGLEARSFWRRATVGSSHWHNTSQMVLCCWSTGFKHLAQLVLSSRAVSVFLEAGAF